MTRAEIVAFNRGLAAIANVAAASAAVLRARLVEAPTRFNFAIGALEGIIGAAADLTLPLPPDGSEPAAVVLPKPAPCGDGEAAPLAVAR